MEAKSSSVYSPSPWGSQESECISREGVLLWLLIIKPSKKVRFNLSTNYHCCSGSTWCTKVLWMPLPDDRPRRT